MKNNDNKKISKGNVTGALSKVSNLAKKTAESMQKGVFALTDKTKESIQKHKIQKYRPLMPDEFKSERFNIPNIIVIVDDAVRRNITVCEGAMGWLEEHKGVEVLHLYDEFIAESGLTFIPFAQCDNVYCVDNFNRKQFVSTNYAFSKSNEEKLAELANIAHLLGAKTCSIEIVDEESQSSVSAFKANKKKGKSVSYDQMEKTSKFNKSTGKRVLNFNGNCTPVRPTLKWFSHDENVKGLIDMRCCCENNGIKSTVLELSGASASTRSKKTACAIDQILKVSGEASMESQVTKEHNCKLIVKIDF